MEPCQKCSDGQKQLPDDGSLFFCSKECAFEFVMNMPLDATITTISTGFITGGCISGAIIDDLARTIDTGIGTITIENTADEPMIIHGN